MSIAADIAKAHAGCIAFDEMVSCLRRTDFAGFDAAKRIFRQINEKEKER